MDVSRSPENYHLKGADKVTGAFLTTIRQAVHNLSFTEAVCNANLTTFNRQELLNGLGSLIPEEAKQSLWEASFDARDLIANEVFNRVLKETRESHHDDVLLNPYRQQHCHHCSSFGHRGDSSYRAGTSSHNTGRSYQGSPRDDYHGGSSGQRGKSFLGGDSSKGGGKSSYRPGRGR